MTTFQDLPPQSRRSARQSERGENPDTPAGFTDFTPPIDSAEPETPDSTHNDSAEHERASDAAELSAEHPSAEHASEEHSSEEHDGENSGLFTPDARSFQMPSWSSMTTGAHSFEPRPTADDASVAETPLDTPADETAAAETPADETSASTAQLTGELPPLTGRRARPSAQHGLFDVPAGDQDAAPTVDAAPAIPGAEPLEYMTQGRDVPESYRAPEPQQPPQPQFRVRDFSPEGRVSGRRAAIPALIEPEPPAQPVELPTDLDYRTHAGPVTTVFPAPVSDPENYPEPVRYIPSDDEVDEHVEAQDPEQVEQSAEADSTFEAAATAEPAFVSPITSSPAFEEPVVVAEVIEEPAAVEDVQPEAPAVVASALPQDYPFLSRRELRARLAQEEAERAALLTGSQDQQDAGIDEQQNVEFVEHHEAELVEPQEAEAESATDSDAASYTGSPAFDFPPPPQQSSLITGSLLTGPQPPAPTTASIPLPPPPPAAASRITDASVPAVSPNPSIFTAPSAFAIPPAFGAPLMENLSDGTSTSDSISPADVTPTFMEPDLEHTGSWEAPVGHWSRQADLDDENQPWENTVTREVGGGNVATTTSALVLPEMPLANPFPSALTGTGEILLTGSIDLPRSLSSGSGDSRHFDDTNVDLMYDTPDSEIASTDSAPVSAIRAVSTHTSARGVINSKKPQGNRMLTVLLVTASVMAAGVVVLLVAGLMGNVF